MAQQAMQGRVLRHLGDGATVVVRRRHSLKTQRQGKPTNALLVNGAHSAGASTLSLRADLLDGTLPKGCKVTAGGTEYTATADAVVSSGVLAVPVSPVLAGSLSDGAAATVTGPSADYTFTVMRGSIDGDVTDAGERQTRRVLHLVPVGTIAPQAGDCVVDGGAEQRIADVKTFNPGGGAARFDVVLGGGG